MKRISMALVLCFSIWGVRSQEIPMLIGTYTSKGSQGIYLYKFDVKTGQSTLESSTHANNPSFLARSKNGKIVYAVDESGAGTAALSAYQLDGDALSLINTVPTGGSSSCHVAVNNKYPLAVVSNYSSGSLTVFSLEKNGALGEVIQRIQSQRTGPDKQRQNASHIHSAFFSADGKRVYVQDLGGDVVTIYTVEQLADSFVLKEKEVVSTPAGGGPRHLVFDKKEKNMYVLLEMSAEIAHFQRQADEWVFIQKLSVNKDDFEGANGAAEIKMSSDEKFIYATNRGEANVIALFNVDKTGGIEKRKVYSTKGKIPRNFNLSPDGKYLIVANQDSDNLVVFERDKNTGELMDINTEVQVSMPVCVLF